MMQKKSNTLTVLLNTSINAKHDRVYPLLSEGSKVRVMVKKTNKTKATDPK